MKISYSFEQESQEFIENAKAIATVITTTVDKVISFGKDIVTAKLADSATHRSVEQSIQIDQLSRAVELINKKLDKLETQKDFYKK